MSKMITGGSGRALSASQILLRKRAAGFALDAPIDLNRATPAQLAAHRLIGKRLAASIVARRRRAPLLPRSTSAGSHAQPAPPGSARRGMQRHAADACMLASIATPDKRCYVGEPFGVAIAWKPTPITTAEVLVLEIRFASGERGRVVHKISPDESKAHQVRLHGFVSARRRSRHRRNPVRRGRERAPPLCQRWRVHAQPGADVHHAQLLDAIEFGRRTQVQLRRRPLVLPCRRALVNGTGASVNLGRRVSVRMTDAASERSAASRSTCRATSSFRPGRRSTATCSPGTARQSGVRRVHGQERPHLPIRDERRRHTVQASRVWRAMRTISYNVIRVGDFSAAERAEYRRAAAEVASDILRSRDMTVHDVELYRIESTPDMDADKTRFRFIDSQAEINDLRSKYTVDNWFLDVFMVESRWDGAFGSSPSGGPVDKQSASSGLVIRRDGDTVNLSQTLRTRRATTLVSNTPTRMTVARTPTRRANIDDNFIFSSSRRDSDVITGCQINKMRQHGLVRSMTP